MGTPAQDEEYDRIRKAYANVAAWQSKYIGTQVQTGFSGGVKMTVETQDGIVASSMQTLGDPHAARIIAEPLYEPPARSAVTWIDPVVVVRNRPAVAVTRPESWFRHLINYLWKGKSS